MKVKSIMLRAVFLAGSLLIFFSCNKIVDFAKGGDDVVFSSQISGNEYIDTKATYAGDKYTDTDSKKKEHIHWSVGDIVKIYCSNGSITEIEKKGVTGVARYQADYVVSEVNSDKTKATIVHNTATSKVGLQWNDDATVEHKFYAVYPSFQEAGKQITRSDQNGIDGKAIYCNLAEVQNTLSGALSSSDGNYTLAPDMKWMLMHGHASFKRANFPAKETVYIEFQPLTTAIQFTITNSVSSDLVIKQLQLLSEKQICGTFDISDVTDVDSNNFPKATHTSAVVGKQVTLDFSSSNVTIAQGKTFTFTFFLSPVEDVNDLKFKIVKGGADDGAILWTRLGYTDGTGVNFPRCKKSFVEGIMVPGGAQWAINYDTLLTEWENGGEENVELN